MKTSVASTTENAATVTEQGAPVAPEKASSKKGATQKKDAPKGQKKAWLRQFSDSTTTGADWAQSQTGARVEVPAKRIPFFKPSKELRALVEKI